MTDMIELRCENCPLCKDKRTLLFFPKEKLKPDLTGMCTVIDLHGIYHQEKPHIRILYVDPSGSVRSFTVIDNLTAIPNPKK